MARATAGAQRGAAGASDSASMDFRIVEDNGGGYHWARLDRDGAASGRLDAQAAIDSSVEMPR